MKKMLAMTCAALCALAASAKTSTPKGFTDDLDAALRRAAENGRRVVAVFSGSDWCGWCKVLDKKILSKEAFLNVATNTYELVYIDNPMDTKVLSETGRKNNRRITEEPRSRRSAAMTERAAPRVISRCSSRRYAMPRT